MTTQHVPLEQSVEGGRLIHLNTNPGWHVVFDAAAWLSGITTQRGHADDAPTSDTTAQAEFSQLLDCN